MWKRVLFWRDIWDRPVRHNKDAEWLKDVENELGTVEAQEKVKIVVSKVKKQVKKMPN